MNFDPVLMTVRNYADYIRILPELVLSIFGMVIMLLDPLVDERTQPALSGRAWL